MGSEVCGDGRTGGGAISVKTVLPTYGDDAIIGKRRVKDVARNCLSE